MQKLFPSIFKLFLQENKFKRRRYTHTHEKTLDCYILFKRASCLSVNKKLRQKNNENETITRWDKKISKIDKKKQKLNKIIEMIIYL